MGKTKSSEPKPELHDTMLSKTIPLTMVEIRCMKNIIQKYCRKMVDDKTVDFMGPMGEMLLGKAPEERMDLLSKIQIKWKTIAEEAKKKKKKEKKESEREEKEEKKH